MKWFGIVFIVLGFGIALYLWSDKDKLSDQELQTLKTQIHQALNEENGELYDKLASKLYRHATGDEMPNRPGDFFDPEEVISKNECKFERLMVDVWPVPLDRIFQDTYRYVALKAYHLREYAKDAPGIEDHIFIKLEKFILGCTKDLNGPHSKLMQEAIDWIGSWETASADWIFDQVLFYRKQEKNKETIFLEKELSAVALEKEHPQAIYEDIQRRFELNNRPRVSTGMYNLVKLATSGYLPAQLDIAQRYLYGEIFELDYAKAAFWYKKAIANGAEGEARKALTPLLASLKATDYFRLKYWENRNEFPRK
ncbi:MAG: SEL1-like repeat protein [Rhodospirillales bacterium]|nr:SEL1-like repeat protein [Rhodospirillales bacterium]